MGNGISQAQSVTKDKEILVDDPSPGQFHRVLVEPDYCLPGPPTLADDPHKASTLRIGTKAGSKQTDEVESTVADNDSKQPESSVTIDNRTNTSQVDKSLFSTDVDYAIIPDDDTAFIIDKENGNSDLPYVISVSSEEDEQLTDGKDEKLNSKPGYQEESKTNTVEDIFQSDNINISEVDRPLSKENKKSQEKTKKNKEKKDSKSVLNMFKFSKHKPKVVAEFVAEVKGEKNKNAKIPTNGDNHICLIDSLKETSVDGDEDVSLIEDNDKNILVQTEPIQQNEKDNSLPNTSLTYQNDTDFSNVKELANVKRLNSLDSGISVDKSPEASMNGHHVVKNDKNDQLNESQDIEGIDDSDKADIITKDTFSSLKTKVTEIINERANEHEVAETVTDVKEQVTETVDFQSGKDSDKDKRKEVESYEPLALPEQDARYSPLEEEKEEKTAEISKSKKKSWSFQFGGNKKNGSLSEKNTSTTSVDKISSSVKKKSKSIWGKLSFRNKSSDDVSMSASGEANDGEILYENEKNNSKKKNKLKKIKAKKEKKGSLKKTIEEPDDMLDTFSNDDRDFSEEIHTPRSRRSIVEDEAPLVQTDAFEGVSVSDLSLDGDVQVVPDSKGFDPHDSPFERELKKSLAKRAEKLHNTEQMNAFVETPNNAHIVKVEIKKPSGTKTANNEEKSFEHVTKTQLELKKESNQKEGEETELVPSDEYAHIIKDIPVNVGPIQPSEYANLHALPEVEPVLEEKNDSEQKLKADNETKDDDNAITEDAVVALKKDKIPEVNKSLSEMLDSLERNVKSKAKSAVIEETVSPEKSNSVSAELKSSNSAVLNAGETSPGAASNSPDESDAYVHLVKLVQDYKDDRFDNHLNNETLVTGTNSVFVNLVPRSPKSKLIPELKSPCLNTQPPIHDTQNPVKQKREVIILKEVGIQAPDIHIPMDIENDFGSQRHGDLVDVGVQVSVNDLNDTENSETDKLIKPSVSSSSAYF